VNTYGIPLDKDMSFHLNGKNKAAKDIETHELSAVSSTTKPYSFKIPSHVIGGIDVLSSHMGISRNQFVNQLINTFLIQAFSEFVDGYSSEFVNQGKSEAQILLDELSRSIDGSDVSDEVIQFLNDETLMFIQEHDMASSVHLNFPSGKFEAE